MKWLITGGCGFIGSRLIKKLVFDGGHFIRVVDNLSVGTRDDLAGSSDFIEVDQGALSGIGAGIDAQLPTPCELINGDILDKDLAKEAARGMDVVVHLAGNTGVAPSVADPFQDCRANVFGTLNYLEGARHGGVKRFPFASSGGVVGECEPPIREELAPHPFSPYGAGKMAAEGYCSAYFKTFGLETVVLRFSNVYGPGSRHKDSAVAKFIRQAISGEPLKIYGDGSQTRDFLYIDDLVEAVIRAAMAPGIGGEVFQIATGTETTISDLLERLMPILRARGCEHAMINRASMRSGDVKRNFSDASKALRILGWQAEWRLSDGLRSTVEWFLNKC